MTVSLDTFLRRLREKAARLRHLRLPIRVWRLRMLVGARPVYIGEQDVDETEAFLLGLAGPDAPVIVSGGLLCLRGEAWWRPVASLRRMAAVPEARPPRGGGPAGPVYEERFVEVTRG